MRQGTPAAKARRLSEVDPVVNFARVLSWPTASLSSFCYSLWGVRLQVATELFL